MENKDLMITVNMENIVLATAIVYKLEKQDTCQNVAFHMA